MSLPRISLQNADIGRIGCMLQGAWFNAANLIINGLTPSHRPSPQKPFRFVRLVSYSLTHDIGTRLIFAVI